jgi:hypothetical protein
VSFVLDLTSGLGLDVTRPSFTRQMLAAALHASCAPAVVGLKHPHPDQTRNRMLYLGRYDEARQAPAGCCGTAPWSTP